VLVYSLARARYVVIEYAGGAVATKCKGYVERDIYELQKLISRTLEEYRNRHDSG